MKKEFIVFGIRPLDFEDAEVSKIIDLLKQNIGGDWKIESPTDESNGIHIILDIKKKDKDERRKELFNLALKLLKSLNKSTINYIKKVDLDIIFKIVTYDVSIQIPAEIINECARIGLSIDVFNADLISK